MKRKEFIECMEIHKFKKYISNALNESFTKNDINASWKIKKFTSKQSPNNVGIASIDINSSVFSKVNIEKISDLETAIREAQLKINNINSDSLNFNPVEKIGTQAENNKQQKEQQL